MQKKWHEIDRISYQIRTVEESDLESLCSVKGDAALHRDRLQQQKAGKAVYLGAFVHHCAVGFVLLSLDNKEDIMPYTDGKSCADMIDLLVMEPLRGCGIGSRLALACEQYCREHEIPYLGLDVNPADNAAAKKLYERLGYHAVGEMHLDGIYEYIDEQGNGGRYEDWCIDMIKQV